MKVLLTGAGGQLARCLQDRCPPHWRLLALGRAELDIADPQAVSRRVAHERPDWIINAAAYTAVDQAETDTAQALAVNAQGAAHLARAASDTAARLLHVSTDYVFDGQGHSPYTERDATQPVNAYGRSKLQGEHAVLQQLPQALVLRTSGVYSEYGNNFVKTMLRLALRARQADAADAAILRIVADQHTCPTYAGDLADAIIMLMVCKQPVSGVHHYCGATAVSWHAFAQHIFECAQQRDHHFPVPQLQAVAARDYPSAAQRPAYSVLSCEKIEALGIRPQPLHASLPAVIKTLMA